MEKSFKQVNKAVVKKDAMNLLLGKPVYVDDITPNDCLIVKVLRSPHAHALIKNRYTLPDQFRSFPIHVDEPYHILRSQPSRNPCRNGSPYRHT